MERRFTGFLLPILIATLVYLLFFGDKPKEPQDKANAVVTDTSLQDPDVQQAVANQPSNQFDENVELIFHTFGELDDTGFQVTWSRYGAGVVGIALNDHYASPQAAKKRDKDIGDYYWIVPAYPPRPDGTRSWDYGLVLEGRGKARFGKAIDDGPKHQLWELEPIAPGANEVKFRLDVGDGLVLEKVFYYERGRRDLGVTINLRRVGDRAADAPSAYQMALRGVHLWNPMLGGLFANPAMAVGATMDPQGEVVTNYKLAKEAAGAVILPAGGGSTFSFAGTTNRFFGGFLYPADQQTEAAVQSVVSRNFPPTQIQIGDAIVEPESVPEILLDVTLGVPKTGEVESLSFRLYLGPKTSGQFVGDYERFLPVMDVDLRPLCCCSVPGVIPLAKAIIWLLQSFHSVVGNWGVAIIMLTLLVRVLLSPLNFNMQRTMRAHGAKMATLKPQLDELQRQHKDDPKRLQMEMMKFNKEHKLISAPLKGCLPILITMPIWFGLFTALRVMYELRHEGFVFWIDDLSQPDRLFATGLAWGPVAYLNLLPILMIGLWLYLQMGTPLPKDPQQRQMMVMMRFMPIMMGVMLYTYTSGLMIYMCTSSVWGIVEQKLTKRILGPVNPDAAGMSPMPMM